MKNKQKTLLPTTTVVKGFKTNPLVEPKLYCKSNPFTQVNKAMSAFIKEWDWNSRVVCQYCKFETKKGII